MKAGVHNVDLNDTIIDAARVAKVMRQKVEVVKTYIEWQLNLSVEELKKIALRIKAQYNKDWTDAPLQSKIKLLIFLKYPTLRMNLVTNRLELCGIPMTDTDLNSIYIKIMDNGVKTTPKLVNTILYSHWLPAYNPFQEFFEKRQSVLPSTFTGSIDALIDSIETDTPNAKLFIKKWLVSIIASMHGKHSPLILVLCGGQNIGKTQFFRRLLPKLLLNYYSEDSLEYNKDSDILMTEKLIIMDDEFGGKNKSESKKLKQLASKQGFSLRRPYGTVHQDLLRIAVLCGTTNESQILNDTTGNRRIIPVNVLSINYDAYNSVNKDYLFWELYEEYINGYSYELSHQDIELLNESTSDFNIQTIEEELISMHLATPDQLPSGTIEKLTCTEIMLFLKEKTNLLLTLQKLGATLRKLGFVKHSEKVNGDTKRVYSVVKRAITK